MRHFYLCTYRSHGAAKRANKAIGNHWYDADAVRFFRARNHSEPDRFGLFITSSQFEASDGTRADREYSVCQVHPTGAVETVKGYGDKFKSKSVAVEFLRQLRTVLTTLGGNADILERIEAASTTNSGHFCNTVEVDGHPFEVARYGTEDGYQVNGAVYYRDALLAYTDTEGAPVR